MPITIFDKKWYNKRHKGVRCLFKVGDVVLYGLHGICKINNIEVKQIGKTALDYYVLNPIFNPNTVLFVPIDNEQLTSKMREILTEQDVKSFSERASQIGALKIQYESTRREIYRDILSCGDREKLLSLIKTIREEREYRLQNSKKLSMADEQTLYKAEQILFNEIAFVLGITPNEAQDKIIF